MPPHCQRVVPDLLYRRIALGGALGGAQVIQLSARWWGLVRLLSSDSSSGVQPVCGIELDQRPVHVVLAVVRRAVAHRWAASQVRSADVPAVAGAATRVVAK
jgi:hypothetical protein